LIGFFSSAIELTARIKKVSRDVVVFILRVLI